MACVCERICSEGGFFAVTASYSLASRDGAASSPVLSDGGSQRVEARLGAPHRHGLASCLLRGSGDAPFHVPGTVALKAPGDTACGHFIFAGFGEQVGQTCTDGLFEMG